MPKSLTGGSPRRSGEAPPGGRQARRQRARDGAVGHPDVLGRGPVPGALVRLTAITQRMGLTTTRETLSSGARPSRGPRFAREPWGAARAAAPARATRPYGRGREPPPGHRVAS